MEVQSECGETPVPLPCDPQPTGNINKAAFKLFGKRRSAFFSFRNKGVLNNGNSENRNSTNGHGSAAAEIVRSRTHDGLTGADGEADGRGGREEGATRGHEAEPARSLSKSFSFFSFLRRGSLRTSENGGTGLARRGRGLKGLFSSMRWRRKEKSNEAEGEAAQENVVGEADGAHPDQVTGVTLTLEALPHQPREAGGNLGAEAESRFHHVETSPTANVAVAPQHTVSLSDVGGKSDPPFPFTPTDSPLHEPPASTAKAASGGSFRAVATPPPDRGGGMADPPSEPSVERLCSLLFTDVTSLKSFDSLTGCGDIIADSEEEVLGGNGGSGTSSSSSGGGGDGGGGGRSSGMIVSASQGSPAKRPLPSQLTRSTFSAVPASMPASLPARPQVSSPQQERLTGSGVVAYMGGGEEMASPEGVDDADMQGLWHMLPSTGDESPALPRPHQAPVTTPATTPTAAAPRGPDQKSPQVKALGLSKIPVVCVGGSRAAKPSLHHTYARQPTSPGEKEPLSDEGYWDTPTATPVEEGLQRHERIILSRDSCSGDHLYDFYNNPEEDREEGDEDESQDPTSTEYKLSPSSQTTAPSSSSSPSFRSMKGSTSLPRDSKIPISVRQSSPPHSVSQSSLSSAIEASAPQPKTQAPPTARTRIPVSKVPVRRSGNKHGNSSRGTAHRK